MGQSAPYFIGKILLDTGFLNQHHLDTALAEQKQSEELLCQVLIRKGVLKDIDIKVPLMLQQHLGSIESALQLAAGERQTLGDLLVQSGHISGAQLDQALSEQRQSGELLGEVFRRLGMLNEQQLNAILTFQRNQGDAGRNSPLRLGELLVTTGKISRDHLKDALRKQKISARNIGEILIEEGYARPGCIAHCARYQKALLGTVLSAVISLGMAAESYAGEMCTFSQQLQSPPMKAQFIAKIASAVGTMMSSGVSGVSDQLVATGVGVALTIGSLVAYNSQTEDTVLSDAAVGITAPAYSAKGGGTFKTQGIDSLSKDCLACHDGVAASGIDVDYKNTPGQPANHYDGKKQHPIGMNYAAYVAMGSRNYKPVSEYSSKMVFVDGKVGCLTCHNPLNPEEKHLVMSDQGSALCLSCHNK